MNVDRLDRDLEAWLEAEAVNVPPDGLHGNVLGLARRTRQHPRWLADARGSRLEPLPRSIARPTRRVAYLVAVVAALLALVLAASAGGFLPTKPVNHLLGRAGLIAYEGVGVDGVGLPARGVRLMNADGTDARPIAQVLIGSCPTFSADGSSLAYTSGSPPALYVAKPDAWSPREVAGYPETSFAVDRATPPTISPDGTSLAWFTPYSAGSELWLTTIADGRRRLLVAAPDDRTLSYYGPSWSPDGRSIAFAVMNEQSDRVAIDVVDVDSGEVRRLTTRPGVYYPGRYEPISWSPDSQQVAFVGLPAGSPSSGSDVAGWDATPQDVFAVAADGTGERNLTESPEYVRRPRWSPDGSRIAYITGRLGYENRVAVVPVDPTDPMGPPLVGPSADTATWSPDASSLFLTSYGDLDGSEGPQFRWVDASLQRTLRTLPGEVPTLCAPSWQRLAP